MRRTVVPECEGEWREGTELREWRSQRASEARGSLSTRERKDPVREGERIEGDRDKTGGTTVRKEGGRGAYRIL